MMKVEEIRVGNWFRDAFSGYTQVEPRDFANWEAINSTPISLTPEIVEACGFKNGYLEIGDQEMQVVINSNEFVLFGSESCTSGQCFSGKIHYLHQLQNLYFALTGNELVFHPVLLDKAT